MNTSNIPSISPPKHQIYNPTAIFGQNAAAVVNKTKTKKEVIASVTDYFLNSFINEDQKDVIEEFEKSDIKHRVVLPLRQAFLSKVPTNDSFIDMYKKRHMHDVTLCFEKDETTIDTHKIVLCTSQRFKNYFQEKINNSKSANIDTVNMSKDYDPLIFAKVLKLMYIGVKNDIDVSLQEARTMFLLACKLQAKTVMMFLIINWILPQMSNNLWLYLLNDAYNRLNLQDESVNLLFQLTKLYWARRFKRLYETQSQVILGMDQKLLMILITQSLYFITDENEITRLMSILTDKVIKIDIFEFCTTHSLKYGRAVAYDYQKLDWTDQIKGLGVTPVKLDLMLDTNYSENSELKLKTSHRRSSELTVKHLRSQKDQTDLELEPMTPWENKILHSSELNSQEPNLDIWLEINRSEIASKGVTFFSEWFYSFSSTWNLKIDIQQDFNVGVYLVERSFKKPDQNEKYNNIVLNAYMNQPNQASKIINNGQNGVYPINFKSVVFSINVIDPKLNKEFVVFHSFCRDQNEVIGCSKFFNLSLLENQKFVRFVVKIKEDTLHAATMHFIASNFFRVYSKEVQSDPDCEEKIKYCSFHKQNRHRSDYKKPYYDNRYRDDYAYNMRNRIENFDRPRKRYGTPPSEVKNKLISHNFYESKIIWIFIFLDHKHKEEAKAKKNKGYSYLHMTYYDLSYVLNSSQLNMPNENSVIDVVHRYCTKVTLIQNNTIGYQKLSRNRQAHQFSEIWLSHIVWNPKECKCRQTYFHKQYNISRMLNDTNQKSTRTSSVQIKISV